MQLYAYYLISFISMVTYTNGFVSSRSSSSKELQDEVASNENLSSELQRRVEHGSNSNASGPSIPMKYPTSPPSSESVLYALVAAVAIIFVSEVGDKTFFIALILAMRHSRFMVFTGALTALALMTTLSAVLGQISSIIPQVYVHYASVALFIIFGSKMIKDGYYMNDSENKEFEEAHKEIENRTSKLNDEANMSLELGTDKTKRKKTYIILAVVFLEALSMTFLAEWGDRSQIATIALAARENAYGVVFGAIIGHAICTFLAVIGGRFVADKISVKTVTIAGGVVFLGFAVWALAIGSDVDNSSNMQIFKTR